MARCWSGQKLCNRFEKDKLQSVNLPQDLVLLLESSLHIQGLAYLDLGSCSSQVNKTRLGHFRHHHSRRLGVLLFEVECHS